MNHISRRQFLIRTAIGGVAATVINPYSVFSQTVTEAKSATAAVSLTTGTNRADMTFRALQPFSKEISRAIGKRRIILKPNNVSINIPLCATHADTLEGLLEFLKSIRKLDNVYIAESAANGPTFDGFSNYGYYRLANTYPVKFMDLDQEGYRTLHVFDERDFRPHPVRFSSVMLDSNSYIVSVARMKTHDRAVVTLSLKNVVLGSPIKDLGFTWGKDRKPGSVNDKPIVHGSGYRAINYNLFDLASRIHPHLSVIDGYEGMEGNGPNNGTPVDHKVCVASTDWLAADRVATELMGVDFANVGYLNFCSQAGMGITDLGKIDIIGENLKDHIKTYKLNDNIEKQLVWLKPLV